MATPINSGNVDDWDEPLNLAPMFTSSHTFSTDDLTVTFAGATVGSLADPIAVFDTTGTNGTKTAKDGTVLYPIDSEFGYYVSDFENAETKMLDGDYAEGWAGNLLIGGEQVGLVLSDSPTDTFKTPALLGTWLAGLGGNSIKASTEHYLVMQNVLSDQAYPGDPDALYPLDDELYIIGGTYDGWSMADAIDDLALLPSGAGDVNGDGVIDIKDVLAPNETQIDVNIAASTDYSVTLKDDGKLLYRWGNMIKKPNDIRMEATLDVPDSWSKYNPDTSLRNLYHITAAELVTHHTLTNNPNDQVRPEDFENEAAKGTLPTYEVVSDYNADGNGPREVWLSTDDYYAGDGTLYEAGTILRDDWLAAQWAASDLAALGAGDGADGFTNAWYTTMDREPFEPDLTAAGAAYGTSGPRWRLKSDKYGQDLPSVVIPDDPSLPPPPTQDLVKYEVGAETQTVINLLDWGGAAVPLSLSAAWQDKPGETSINGVNYTAGFDVAFYVKGDIKPATLYSTELVMDFELVTPYAVGDAVTGTTGGDFLAGIGSNSFSGLAGADTFVVSYGSSVDGVLTANTITDFTIGEDALAFIDLGVTLDNFDETVSQAVVGGNLEISIDSDGTGTDAAPELVVTLTGVTQELDVLSDFLLPNPGAASGPAPTEPTVITGTEASETLTGTIYDDEIFGLGGNDNIFALAGDDVLDGGAGLDRLSGGLGADVFVFAEGTRLDIVTDFLDGVDLVQLVGLDAADFATAVSIADYSDGDSLITIGADRMIVRDIASADLTIDDFIFDDTAFI